MEFLFVWVKGNRVFPCNIRKAGIISITLDMWSRYPSIHPSWSRYRHKFNLSVKLSVHSGIIRTALPNMDREARQEYNVVIQAKDMGGHMGGLSGTTEVKITLTDVNDNPPKFPLSEWKHQLHFCIFLSPETSAGNGLPSFPWYERWTRGIKSSATRSLPSCSVPSPSAPAHTPMMQIGTHICA